MADLTDKGGMASGVTTTRCWFALYTKPHKEYLVRDLLHSQGVEVYLPEVRVAVPRRGRRRRKPFFPHYLFARFETHSGLMSKTRWTPGLRWVVSAGGQPVPVSDEVVSHIRHRLAMMEVEDLESPFKKGDVVRIVCGPLKGLDAIFDQRLSSAGRARAFLQLMNRQVAAELDLEALLPPQ